MVKYCMTWARETTHFKQGQNIEIMISHLITLLKGKRFSPGPKASNQFLQYKNPQT